MRSLPLVLLLILAAAGPAEAAVDPAAIARSLADVPVYVQPGADPSLSAGQVDRLAERIEKLNPGRMRIVVLKRSDATRFGGIAKAANAISNEVRRPGTLVAVAGSAFYTVVSWGTPDQATSLLRSAVEANRGSLYGQLADAAGRFADNDPGEPEVPATPPSVQLPEPVTLLDDDPFDALFDTVRQAVLIVVAIVCLPFLIVAFLLVRRARGRAVMSRESLADEQQRMRAEHVALGDGIRELDIDVSMPGATQAGVDHYAAAVARYDDATRLMRSADDSAAVGRARQAIAEGQRSIAAARGALAPQQTGLT